jgi:hypothetical protein
VARPDRADPTRPVWFGGVSGSLRFRAPVAADAPVGFIVGLVRLAYSSSLFVWAACVISVEYPRLPGLFVLSACTIDSEYPLLLSPFVCSVCTITSEYLLLSPFVWSVCTITSEYPLPIPFVWFVCTIALEYLRMTVEQGKRSSPKTLCRGPSGVLANSVFGLPVRAL